MNREIVPAMELTKQCMDCGLEKPLSAFRFCYNGAAKNNRPDYAERNPVKARQNRCKKCYGNRERARYRIQFLEAYGGKCHCCGEADPRFLTLDHVQDDGNEERQIYSCQQIYMLAKKQGYPKDKYQIACCNCNFGKSTNGGVCPHKTGLSVADAWEHLRVKYTYIGRAHVELDKNTFFRQGFDAKRMQLNRRVLKPCQYCGKEFGTNEMVRHKRAEHAAEFAAKRKECLAIGQGHNRKDRVEVDMLEQIGVM